MPDVDHIRIMTLVETVYEFCLVNLKPGGSMVAKVLQGGTENTLLQKLKKSFRKVVHFKPAASRQDSSEMYVVAMGFRVTLPSSS
jgi:23S rRNA (uridine2552-2'-O)-methyltransferase